jgi:hypothetical protein
MTRGRYVPPRNPTVEQMAAQMNQPGLYILEFKHNDGCPTIRSQRWQDCTCGDDVDHELVPFVESRDYHE